ncbi:hypothetical protein STXM2123_2705 [Streptomyces sp. F-3]|nr:hypothetical protein STXM2123_2705 [Streptomyces sp. F-3]
MRGGTTTRRRTGPYAVTGPVRRTAGTPAVRAEPATPSDGRGSG